MLSNIIGSGVNSGTGIVPDLVVSGTISPDATGNYFQGADYEGNPTYVRADMAYTVWYGNGSDRWRLTPAAGDNSLYWRQATTGLEALFGNYAVNSNTTGTAVVAAG